MVPLKHGFVYSHYATRAWAHRRCAYTQLSPLYLLSTLYVTHVIKYSRPSTTFPYCKRWKAGRGLGTRVVSRYCECVQTCCNPIGPNCIVCEHCLNNTFLSDGVVSRRLYLPLTNLYPRKNGLPGERVRTAPKVLRVLPSVLLFSYTYFSGYYSCLCGHDVGRYFLVLHAWLVTREYAFSCWRWNGFGATFCLLVCSKGYQSDTTLELLCSCHFTKP